MSVLHQDSGGIGKSIPSALEISLDPRDFPRASPSGNLSGLRKSLGRQGWISQYLPHLGGARIQSGNVASNVIVYRKGSDGNADGDGDGDVDGDGDGDGNGDGYVDGDCSDGDVVGDGRLVTAIMEIGGGCKVVVTWDRASPHLKATLLSSSSKNCS